MPTYNNVNYPSLPQQVGINKSNIKEIQNYLETFGVKVFSTTENLESQTLILKSTLSLLGRTPVVGDYVLGFDGYVGTIKTVTDSYIELTNITDMKGPQGPDGTPVAGIEITSSVDATLGGRSIDFNAVLSNSSFAKTFTIKNINLDATGNNGLNFYVNDIIQTQKVSFLDRIIVWKTASYIRIYFYNENGEATYYTSLLPTDSIKIQTPNLGTEWGLSEILGGSTVGPQGPQGIQGPQGPEGSIPDWALLGSTTANGNLTISTLAGKKDIEFIHEYLITDPVVITTKFPLNVIASELAIGSQVIMESNISASIKLLITIYKVSDTVLTISGLDANSTLKVYAR